MKMFSKVLIGFVMVGFLACSDDDDEAGKVGFEETEESGSEDSGAHSVTLSLGKKTSVDVEVAFALKGTAALNGDYKLLTPSPVKIAAGSSSAEIIIQIIDEAIIESESDVLSMTITSITGHTLNSSEDNLTYTYTINDNDEIPEAGMQVDLSWNLGEGADIDAADLDVYLAYNVVVEEDNSIGSFDINADIYSDSASGFESYVIDSTLKDDAYYVVVVYTEGNVAVPFSLGFNVKGTEPVAGDGEFSNDEVGYALFYGPVQKKGSSFSRQRKPEFVKAKLTSAMLNSLN